MSSFKIEEKVFHSEVHVIIDSYAEYERYVRARNPVVAVDWSDHDEDEDGAVITIGLRSYVWFNRFEGTEAQCYATVGHECGHVAFEVLRYLNFTVDESEKEEIFLYLQQFYAMKISEKLGQLALKKQKQKRRKS